MTIYYTRAFSGGQVESHRLLELAIADHIKDSDKAGRSVAEMKTGRMGKPYIDGFDCFSISHTNDVWAVLFGGRECGLDIQYHRNSDILSISKRFYSSRDAELIREAYGSDPDAARNEFFRIWARREALVKAMGDTAFDSGLPSVANDMVEYKGAAYSIFDISIPDEENLSGLSAAICFVGVVQGSDLCINFRKLVCDTQNQS